MSAPNWQTSNAQYLSLAIEWLRLRLMSLAQAESADSAQPISDAQITRVADAMNAFESIDPLPALIMLRQRLGLSRFESEVLLLCAGMELDTRVAGLCARAQGDPQRPFPTFALALALFDDPSWEALSPDRPLRYWRLIDINQPGAQPLTASALRADERIVNYLKGLNRLDDRLANVINPIESAFISTRELPASQEAVANEIAKRWRRVSADEQLPIAQLLGPDSISKRVIAARTAALFGRHLYQLTVESLSALSADLEMLTRLWQRESILLPLALYLDAQEIDRATPEHNAPLARFLLRADGILFLGVRESLPRLPRASFNVEVARPTTTEQQAIWYDSLGQRVNDYAAQLAAQFNLNQMTIEEIAHEALSDADPDDELLKRALWTTSSSATRPRLDVLAQRLDPKATWDDLVLPVEQTVLLRQIAQQVRQRHTVYEDWGFAAKMNRGLGISALFGGNSGTGKTMAAEVIANELRLNLYRIDLSAVVSKYIGETEKNLRHLFDAAEDGGAILFFDEADALFGKRSEVKDSHDRYANIEINYLLQRMEAYRGLAILATNMKGALDLAFMRRLRFIVDFPVPSAVERKLIWLKVFPPNVPKEALDYDRLARLGLTGGNIHSIALNAAFLAAQSGERVALATVLAAARAEFRKLDKPINESDFR